MSPSCPRCQGFLGKEPDPAGFTWIKCFNCGDRWAENPEDVLPRTYVPNRPVEELEVCSSDMTLPTAPVDPALLKRVREACQERMAERAAVKSNDAT